MHILLKVQISYCSCRLTILVPPGDTLNVIKKPSRSGTKRPTREHLRRESKEEPP